MADEEQEVPEPERCRVCGKVFPDEMPFGAKCDHVSARMTDEQIDELLAKVQREDRYYLTRPRGENERALVAACAQLKSERDEARAELERLKQEAEKSLAVNYHWKQSRP